MHHIRPPRTVFLPALLAVMALGLFHCQHDPFLADEDMTPTDGSDPQTDTLCDPDVVYFDNQVLPILRSNCALSGCHNAATAEEGIVLESYESLMRARIVDTRSPSESKLYEVLVKGDGDERMPPPPAERLDPELIDLIADWIRQGAKNLKCEQSACQTTDLSFAGTILPILKVRCVGCHSGTSASGGIRLNTHAGVKAVADNGRLMGAITWASGFKPMPEGGAQLPDCEISQIQAWVDQGALNN